MDKTFNFYQQQVYTYLYLHTPRNVKNTYFATCAWFPDQAGAHDQVIRNAVGNRGEYVRPGMIAQSSSCYLRGRLILDLFNVGRPMCENVTITIRFIPNVPEQCLVSTSDDARYAVKLSRCELIVPRLYPKREFLNKPAVFPWTKIRTLRFMHNRNSQHFDFRNLYSGPNIPKRCIVLLMDEARFQGSYATNRLKFDPLDVDEMLILVNDEHKPYHNGYRTDFSGPTVDYTELYYGLFRELGKIWDPSTLDALTYDDFRGGYCFWVFDLTPNGTGSSTSYAPPENGSVKLRIHFKNAPTDNVTVLVMLEEERVLYVDKNRNWEDKSLSENGG